MKPTEDQIATGIEFGWSKKEAETGYGIFTSDYGNGATHIEKIDVMGTFESDDEAAEQAEKDGVKIIRDLELPEGHQANYIDTPENRELLKTLGVF